jgi:hypothetical protein
MLLRDLALNAPDPALASHFLVKIPLGNYTKDIIAERVTATFPKTPANPRFNGGSNSYFPGTTDIDGLSISFRETYDYRVTKWLNEWRLLVFDQKDGTYGMPINYKKTINVVYFGAGSNKPKDSEYLGCWPTDKGPFSCDYSDETGRLIVEVQFSVDSMNWKN